MFNFSFSTEHTISILYFYFISFINLIIRSSLYPIASTILLTPISTNALIYHSTIGNPQKGTNGFGSDMVSGLNLVPIPPTNINAFIFIK